MLEEVNERAVLIEGTQETANNITARKSPGLD